MVTPNDLEAPGNMIIYEPYETPERLEAFSRVAKAAKAHGSLAVVQLSHAGRQVYEFVNPNPVSASDVQLKPSAGVTFGKPTALTKEGIKIIINQVLLYNKTRVHRSRANPSFESSLMRRTFVIEQGLMVLSFMARMDI